MSSSSYQNKENDPNAVSDRVKAILKQRQSGQAQEEVGHQLGIPVQHLYTIHPLKLMIKCISDRVKAIQNKAVRTSI